MKILSALALLLTLVGTAAAQHAIRWSTIGGGGGQSSGGVYTLAGTIGQTDASQRTGGTYALTAGFWSVAAVVSSDDAPTLRILPGGRSIILAWPDPSTGFQLQQSTDLSSPTWSDIRVEPDVVGTEKQVTILLQPGKQFFRLRRP